MWAENELKVQDTLHEIGGKCNIHHQNREGPTAPWLCGDVTADGNVSSSVEDAFKKTLIFAHHILPPDVIKLHNTLCLLLRERILIKGLPLTAIYRNIAVKTNLFLAKSAHSFISPSIEVLAETLCSISDSSGIGLFGRTHLLFCDLRIWRSTGDNVCFSDFWRLSFQKLELFLPEAEIIENEPLRAFLEQTSVCQYCFFGLIVVTFFPCLSVLISGSCQPVYLDSVGHRTSKAEHGKMPSGLTCSSSISASFVNCPRVLMRRSCQCVCSGNLEPEAPETKQEYENMPFIIIIIKFII